MHEQIVVIRLLTLAMLRWLALAAAPVVKRVYAAPDNDAPPPPPTKSQEARSRAKPAPALEDAAFASGYRAAYATIYDRHDYASAIEQLKALGHDDSAAVANLIGYSYRKLGDYKVSQVWYERALKADPNHVKTWQYYGLWQVEQGNRDSGAISPEPDRRLGRHRQRGISLARRRTRKAARHRSRLLIQPKLTNRRGLASRAGFLLAPASLHQRLSLGRGTPDARRRANRTCGRPDRPRA